MPTELLLHDARDFPLVRSGLSPAREGHGVDWCADMDQLMAQDRRFILIDHAMDHDESHEDRKIRGAWMKRHREVLARLCIARIIIEPDPARRAALQAMLPKLNQAFGIVQGVCETPELAGVLAHELLADAGSPPC